MLNWKKRREQKKKRNERRKKSSEASRQAIVFQNKYFLTWYIHSYVCTYKVDDTFMISLYEISKSLLNYFSYNISSKTTCIVRFLDVRIKIYKSLKFSSIIFINLFLLRLFPSFLLCIFTTINIVNLKSILIIKHSIKQQDNNTCYFFSYFEHLYNKNGD